MELILLGFMICVFLMDSIVLQKRISSFAIIMAPYIMIVFLNNLVATRFGFIRVTENTMVMVLFGCFFFFVGNCVIHLLFNDSSSIIRKIPSDSEADLLSVQRIKFYVTAALLIRVLQIGVLFLKYGLEGIVANDFALMVTRGPIGHLMISVFPLIPVLFYHWLLDKRDVLSLFLTVLYFVLAFVETEKVQVLTILIAVFLYCVFKNQAYLVRGGIIAGALIAALFMGNYAMKFILQGYYSKITGDYYVYRLWNYIAGSLINTRAVTDMFAAIRVNGIDYLVDVLLALPNLFIKGLTGQEIGPDVRLEYPYIRDFMDVTIYADGRKAQKGNVLSTMTYAFGNGNWIAFAFVMILWGIISEYVISRMYQDKRDVNIMTCCCFMSFSMISFFGSYFTSASFSERLVFCLVWAFVFSKKLQITAADPVWDT